LANVKKHQAKQLVVGLEEHPRQILKLQRLFGQNQIQEEQLFGLVSIQSSMHGVEP
jgi:hypothetical protein